MAYPVMASRQTWFKSTIVTVNEVVHMQIQNEATDDFINDLDEYWFADADNTGSIVGGIKELPTGYSCYIIGNGSGKIALNSDSSQLFCQFYGVTNIIGAHLLDTSNVTDFSFAFSGRLGEGGEMALQSIDVSTWDTSKCTNMSGMFLQCVALEELHVSNWNTGNVKSIMQMFWGCNKLKTLDVSRWDVGSLNGESSLMGTFGYCSVLTELDISKWKFNPEATGWNFVLSFVGLNSIKELDLTPIPFDKANLIMNMFSYLSSVETLKLPGQKFGNIKSFHGWFQECSTLKNLDTSAWDTHSCEDMSFMFYGCTGLKEIDVSHWDTSKVKTFDHFAAHALLRRKGIENWDTSSCENMNAMFHNCAEEELDLSGYKTDKVRIFCQMFENSPNLKRVKGLDKWNTANGESFEQMFGRCYQIEEIDLSAFDTTKAKNDVECSTNGHTSLTLENFCNDCRNLKWIKLGKNFAVNGDGSNTIAANRLILPTPSAEYLDGADGLWRTFDGTTYAPAGIPDRTANTYYSSYNSIADVDVIVKNGSLLEVAKAIREINGNTEKYVPAQLGAAIQSLGVALKGFVITGQPQSVEVSENEHTIFTVRAIGEGLAYQWQFKNALEDWKDSSMPGSTTVNLHVQATAARDGYSYRVIITDINGEQLISEPAYLYVKDISTIVIISHPQSLEVEENEYATFTVEAKGENLTYQWQFTNSFGNWENSGMTGSNTASITVQATAARNGYGYRVVITDAAGKQLVSEPAYLTVKSSTETTALDENEV